MCYAGKTPKIINILFIFKLRCARTNCSLSTNEFSTEGLRAIVQRYLDQRVEAQPHFPPVILNSPFHLRSPHIQIPPMTILISTAHCVCQSARCAGPYLRMHILFGSRLILSSLNLVLRAYCSRTLRRGATRDNVQYQPP